MIDYPPPGEPDGYPLPDVRTVYIVVLRTPAGRCAFLNREPKPHPWSRTFDPGMVWGPISSCTQFKDPADAVASALIYDAEVARLEVNLGVTQWWLV